MNHISEENLIEFADGVLSPEKQMEAESHLSVCSQCREELEMYRSLSVLMEKENLVMAPPSMTNNVMQQVELHQHIMLRKAKSRKTFFRFGAFMVGILAIITALGIVLVPQSGPAFQMPDFVKDVIDYMLGLKISVKNPLILYVAVSVVILLVSERILSSFKPRKVVA
jgi:anti-sigma factor RsiW